MNKQRSAILGVALAILGAAACEDKTEVVVPPPPPPPLQISVTPATLKLEVGQTQQVVAQVTGGDTATVKTVTWTSSAPTIASVTAVGNVATVKGEGEGVATIRATATADANVTAAVSVEVTPAGGVPPSISIQSITQGATNLPVNEQNVFGQVEVTLNLEVPTGTRVSYVQLTANDVEFFRQTFQSPELGASADEAQNAAIIIASWNTADFVRSDTSTGTRVGRFRNGPTTVKANVVGEQGTITAQNTRQIVLNNVPLVYARRTSPTGSPACLTSNAASVGFPTVAAGSLWCTGDVTFTAFGVDYSGDPNNFVGRLTLSGTAVNVGPTVVTRSAQDTTPPFSLTLQKSGGAAGSRIDTWEAAGVSFTLNGVTRSGQPLSGCVATEATPSPLNLNCLAAANGQVLLPNPLNVDNVAPALAGTITVPTGSNNWIGPKVTVASLAAGVTAVDQGVGGVTPTLQYTTSPANAQSTFTTAAAVSDIPESTVNTAFDIRIRFCDLLGNCANSPLATVGSDKTQPTNVAYAPGSPADQAVVRTSLTNPAPINTSFTFALTGSDALSGPFDTFGTLKRLNPNNTTTCVFGSGTACNPVSNVLNAPFTVNAPAAEGFYTFEGLFRDLARNETPIAGRTVVSDATDPLVQNIVLPSTLPAGGSATHSAVATDNLDLKDWRFHTIYANGTELPSGGFTAFNGFGPPLVQNAPVSSTAEFIKSIEFTAAMGTLHAATAARFTVRDQALNFSSAFNNYAAGTVPAGTSATALGVNAYVGQIVPGSPAVICDPNGPGAPCGTTPASTNLEARASGLSGTFNFPFNKVAFFRVDGAGQYHFIGETTARLSTDNGVAGDPLGRVWTYGPVAFSAAGFGGAGAINIVAIGVDTTGDALISAQFVVTVN